MPSSPRAPGIGGLRSNSAAANGSPLALIQPPLPSK
jgi:hypothetical protein